MTIKKILLYIILISFVSACQKENNPNNNSIQASSQLNVNYGSQMLQNMDIFLPAGRSSSSTKVMILIHGGAWVLGDKTDFNNVVDSLKKRLPDYAIFNINYRLSAFPLNVFPTQEMDVKSAVEFIYSKRTDYLISDKFVLAGASAGAHLSMLQAYKNSSPVKIKAVINFFGPVDMVDLYNNPGIVSRQSIAAIVGATPTSNPSLYQQSSPINFAMGGAACPTLILQGSADPLVNAVSQSEKLRDKLQIAGVAVQYVSYAGKGHGDDWGSAIYFDAFNKLQNFVAFHNP